MQNSKIVRWLYNFLNHPIIRAITIAQFILAIVIFYYAALMPFNNAPSSTPAWTLHLIGNILLALSASIAAYPFVRLRTIFITCCALSGIAELAQLLTENRFADPLDALTNFVGLLIGCALAVPLFILKRQSQNKNDTQ